MLTIKISEDTHRELERFMNSFQLKLVAIAAMTLDHVSKMFWVSLLFLLFPALGTSAAGISFASLSSNLMQWAGRMAFPLFAFMVAEGCRHTRSMPKYLLRLGIFTAVSQPFYWLAFHDYAGFRGLASVRDSLLSLLRPGNVFVTLLLGALAIYTYQLLRKRSKWLALLAIPVLATACLLAGPVLHSDYEFCGVLLIAAIYLAPNKYLQAGAMLLFAAAMYLLLEPISVGWPDAVAAALAAVPVLLYNGQRGRPMKWIFYWYYPAHLLLFTVVRVLVVGG